MASRIDGERLKTYLFGFAIGCVLVAMILLVKSEMAGRELARAEAAAAANANHPSPAPPPDSSLR